MMYSWGRGFDQLFSKKLFALLLFLGLGNYTYSQECSIQIESIVADCNMGVGSMSFYVTGLASTGSPYFILNNNDDIVQSGTVYNENTVQVTGLYADQSPFTIDVTGTANYCSAEFTIPTPVLQVQATPVANGGDCEGKNYLQLEVTNYNFQSPQFTFFLTGPNGYSQQQEGDAFETIPFSDLYGTNNFDLYTWSVVSQGACYVKVSGTFGFPGGGPSPDVTITGNSPDFTYVDGSTIQLTANVSNIPSPPTVGELVYTWTGPNGTLPSGKTLTIASASPDDLGEYTVTVNYVIVNGKSIIECTGTATQYVTVQCFGFTDITTTPPCPPGVNNGSITVTMNGGQQPYDYFFLINGGPNYVSNSVTTNPFTVGNLASADYMVSVTDYYGCNDTTPISEPVVVGLPLQQPALSNPVQTCPGYNVGMINVTASDGTPPYRVSINGVNFQSFPPNSNTTTLTGLPASGVIYLRDANNCTTSTEFDVGTQPAPSVSIVSAPQNDNICGSTAPSLVANATGRTGGPYTYLWYVNGGTNPIGSGPILPISQPGDYTVVAYNNSAPYCSNSSSLTIDKTLTATITPANPAICSSGSNVQLAANPNVSGNLTYVWTLPNGSQTLPSANNTIPATQTGTYSVTISDTNGCSKTVSTTVNSAAISSLNYSADCSGNITITGQTAAYGSPVTATSTSTSPSPLTATVTSNASNGRFTINFSGAAVGQYTFNIYPYDSNNVQCTSDASQLNITMRQGFTISIDQGNPDICGETTPQLNATAQNGPVGDSYTYAWTTPYGIEMGPTIQPESAGNYYVTVSDTTTGCSFTSSTVNVNENLTAGITPSDIAICSGNSVLLSAMPSQSGAYTYTWSLGDTVMQQGPSSTYPAGPTQPGINTYSVSVTDTNGCHATAMANVSVISIDPGSLVGTSDCNGTVTIQGSLTSNLSDITVTASSTIGSLAQSASTINGAFTIQIANVVNGTYTFDVYASDSNNLVCQKIPVAVTVGMANLSNIMATGSCPFMITITGFADPGDTVTVSGDLSASLVAPSSGFFEFALSTNGKSGTFNLSVIATNNSGTVPCTSQSVTLQPIVPQCEPGNVSIYQKCCRKKACDGSTKITVTVRNDGTTPSTGIVVTQQLPECMNFLRATGANWTFSSANSQVLAIYNESLAPGQEVSYTLRALAHCYCTDMKKMIAYASILNSTSNRGSTCCAIKVS